MLLRTITFAKSNQAPFTTKIICPQPYKSIVSHIPNIKMASSSPRKMRLGVNFSPNSSNSKNCEDVWIFEEKHENNEELASWQSLEDLKNLEYLRSSTQNPVEKDFFFQSLNEEKCFSTGSSDDCEELFDV